jgi:hypothetical protein
VNKNTTAVNLAEKLWAAKDLDKWGSEQVQLIERLLEVLHPEVMHLPFENRDQWELRLPGKERSVVRRVISSTGLGHTVTSKEQVPGERYGTINLEDYSIKFGSFIANWSTTDSNPFIVSIFKSEPERCYISLAYEVSEDDETLTISVRNVDLVLNKVKPFLTGLRGGRFIVALLFLSALGGSALSLMNPQMTCYFTLMVFVCGVTGFLLYESTRWRIDERFSPFVGSHVYESTRLWTKED